MAAPLPVLVARGLFPDPHGRPHFSPVLPPLPTAPVGTNAVDPDVAGVKLGCVRSGGECPGAAVSLSPMAWEFPVATKSAYPGFAFPLAPGSPSDDGAAPSGGITPAAKGSLSRVGPVSSAVTLTAAGVELGCLRGGAQASRHHDTPISGREEVPRGYTSSVSWLRLPPYPRVTFRRRSCAFPWRCSHC